MTSLPVYRPLQPGDEAHLVGLFSRLTSDEIRQRFGHVVRALPDELVQAWCAPDGRRHIAWGVFEPRGAGLRLRGVCRAFVEPTGEAEWAIVVERSHTGQGWACQLGGHVLAQLDSLGVHQVEAHTAADNHRMGALARRLGFHATPGEDATQTRFVRLAPPLARPRPQAA